MNITNIAMDFMTNKKSPDFGLFSSIYKYKKKRKLRKKIYLQFEDAVNKRDYTMIEITTKRYLKWK